MHNTKVNMQPSVQAVGNEIFGHTRTFDLRRKPRLGETLIQSFLFACGFLSILTTFGIVVVLFREAWLFFGSEGVNLLAFFGTTKWQPHIFQFGIWPLLNATLMTSAIALCVSLPLGLCA